MRGLPSKYEESLQVSSSNNGESLYVSIVVVINIWQLQSYKISYFEGRPRGIAEAPVRCD